MLRAIHRAGHGLLADLVLYLTGATFAALTAVTSTLPAHRPWGQIALFGYAVAAALTVALHLTRRHSPAVRAVVVGIGWLGVTIVPLLVEATQRVAGNPYRAQEEVVVVEHGAARLLETGTPYLTREAIAATPDPLLGYLPYQPGMTVFGLPRAVFGVHVWTDARVWFALATAGCLVAALRLLRHAGVSDTLLVRAAQAVTVLPICALTLATGGDDLPVLGLCLLALAYASRGRWTASGIAVGTAGALKLFAWPVAVVLLVHAYANRRGALSRQAPVRLGLPALGIPIAVLIPVTLISPSAVVENLVKFPLGLGLVKTPAASPLPGQLIATLVPGGRAIAGALLVAAAVGLGIWLLRRPPNTAGEAATVCAVGLLLAILLMPATRFGYLLYPAAYAVWAVGITQVGTERPAVPSKGL
jgi:hypothetical protein